MKIRELSGSDVVGKAGTDQGLHKLLLHLIWFGCGFLASGGSVLGSYAPFGISMCAAVPFPGVIPSFLGALAGYIFLSAGRGSFRYIAAMIAVLAIRWTLADMRRLQRYSLYPAVICFVPVFATGMAMMSVSGFSLRIFSIYATEALLSGAGAWFISKTIIMLSGTRSLGMLMPQELACLVMTVCIGVLALSGFQIGGLSIGRILSVLMILICARCGGIAGGAVAGIAFGAVLGLSSLEYAFLGASYAFGGLMAGLFLSVGRIAAAGAFILSSFAVGAQTALGEDIIRCAYESLAGGLIFIFLPKDTGNFLRAVFLSGNTKDHAEELRKSIIMRLDFASKALSDVKDNVEEVSERLSKIITPTMESVYREASDDLCRRCGMKVFCWEHKDGISLDSFSDLDERLTCDGSVTEESLGHDLSRKCCRTGEMAAAINKSYRNYLASRAAEKRIDEVRQVVAGQFCGLGEILSEMAEEYSNYETFDTEAAQSITIKLKELGLSPVSVSCRVDSSGRMTIEAETEDASDKKIRRAALVHELSRICGRKFDSPSITFAEGRCRLMLCERPMLDVETAGSQHVCRDGKLCGDHMRYFTDGSGRMDVILSDGMGTGGRAAVDGGMAASIMEKLIKAGLGFECSLKVVNSALLVKSGDESLATLDVLSVDLYSGRTLFMKAGAALSIIRKQGEIYLVDTPSLPAGILPEVSFTCTEDDLSEGDIIVMVSDGAVASGTEWIERMIASWEDESMEDLCCRIVDEASSRRKDGHDDDITAIAMRLCKCA